MRIGPALACLLTAWTAVAALAEDTCVLVDQGTPNAVIVVAEKPSRMARFAADELAHYVVKLTGSSLPIVPENRLTDEQAAGYLVLVGESRRTRDVGLVSRELKPQEHVIRNAGRWLILMGRDEEDYGPVDYTRDMPWPECRLDFPWRVYFKAWGSLYAVDTFLERFCGVRWYLPGEIGEVAPRTESIATTGIDLRLRPWTKCRLVGGASAWDPFDFYTAGRDPQKRVPRRDMLLWWLRMKMGGEPWQVNHSVYSYHDRFAETHPEWFADGKPRPRGHLCYTHPGFIAQHAQDARDYFDGKFPTMTFPGGGRVLAAGDYYPAVPIDSSSGWCGCPRCRALLEVSQPIPQDVPGAGFFNGRYSEYVWTFVNGVARDVRRTHPDKWISAIAYARYFQPPQHVELEPNISVCVTKQVMLTSNPAAKEYFREALRQWHRRAGELYVWEYYLNQYFNRYTAFPWITPRLVGEDIEFLKTVGVVGKFVEISPWKSTRANMAQDLLPAYVTMKLLADDSRSVDEILEEHYRLFYGPAAGPMRAFFEGIEDAWQSHPEAFAPGVGGQRRSWEILCPPEELTKHHQRIVAARRLAAAGEPYATRVRLIEEAVYRPMEKHCLEYAQRKKNRRRMTCPMVTSVPAIDGRLDDAAWQQASRTPPLVGTTMEEVEVSTVGYVARDDRMLYLAVDCPEPQMDQIRAEHNTPDSLEVCLDDDVELFIDMGRTRQKYYHLVINSRGTLADRAVGMGLDDGGVAWNSGTKAVAGRTPQGWCVEMAVPLASIGASPKPGDVWGFNVCRVRHAGVKQASGQWTCWSPTFGGFNTPDEFGILTMAAAGGATAGAARAGLPRPVVELDFEDEITGSSGPLDAGEGMTVAGERLTATARLRTLGDGKPWDASCLAPGPWGNCCVLDAAAKRYIQVEFPPEFGLARGDFTLMFRFKTDRAEGQCLAASTTTAPFWLLGINEIKGRRLLRLLLGAGPPTVAVNAEAPPADGHWHHLAFTLDRGGRATIYLDGHEAGSTDIREHREPLKDAMTLGGPYNPFHGAIDTVQIYGEALSPDQIDGL